ncbi:MAG: fasciclin domain-containing protein [Bacteroidales bacterium]|jgi:uncharacterized surface protein with fasciclin (FAS1) repeats|nr:fasciclin domain-containing protein [Bacteroidales bacterium]
MKQIINKTGLWTSLSVVAMFGLMTLWHSCKDDLEGKTFLTSDMKMIDDYILENEADEMTLFLQVADKAVIVSPTGDKGSFRGMLHSYGKYTCFAPSNQAITEYLGSLDKSTVDQLSVEECVTIMKYHVVRDSLRTIDFVDGRLPLVNMLTKYITTKTVSVDGKPEIQLNRQAIIVKKDIHCGNGYIQKIDHVLIPPALTSGEQIDDLPDDQYSLFKSIMLRTGLQDTLTVNKADNVWFTVFLQSNAAFHEAGIDNIDDLVEKMKTARADIALGPQPETMSKEDSLLWTFAAYHIVKSLYYVADLTKASALPTLAPLQNITFILKGDSLFVDEFTDPVSNAVEPGMKVDKSSEYTDYSCYNGVLIDVKGYVGPKIRKAQAVFWEFTDQPEIRKNPQFRKGNFDLVSTAAGTYELEDMVIKKGASRAGDFAYTTRGTGYNQDWALTNNDYMTFNWYRLNDYAEFRMPLLMPGEYKVWLCHRAVGSLGNVKVKAVFKEEGFEDQTMSTLYNPQLSYDNSKDPEMLLTSGMKRFTAKISRGYPVAILLGTVKVNTTGRHWMRFTKVSGGNTAPEYIDMLQFIPVDEDQLWPRFDILGRKIYPDTPCCEIAPMDGVTSCNSGNALQIDAPACTN